MQRSQGFLISAAALALIGSGLSAGGADARQVEDENGTNRPAATASRGEEIGRVRALLNDADRLRSEGQLGEAARAVEQALVLCRSAFGEQSESVGVVNERL